MTDPTATIADFLTAAAAKQATPGGGSVTALVGALAASMGEMVLNYSVAKKDLLQHTQSNQQALHELTNARNVLTQLLVEDQLAYTAFTKAKKEGIPPAEMAAIVLACIRVPQAIGATGVAILEIANRVVGTSNRWLLSDLAVCGELAAATVRCAAHNVRVNLSEVSDVADRLKLESECDRMIIHAVQQVRLLMPAIAKLQAGT
jgi:formiminotetrahydrofolate cyclodeaminase